MADAKKKDPMAGVPIERQGVVDGDVIEVARAFTIRVGGKTYHHKGEDAAGRWVYAE